MAALREAGVAQDDLRTEQISVYPRTGEDGLSVTGYDASNTVRATIRDLDRAGPTVDAAVAAGADQVSGPTLTVSDAESQYADAVDAAFDDARARAEAIAEKADQEARHTEFNQVAEERYARIVATGKTIPWSEMRSYLEDRAASGKARRPTARKLAR